MSKDQTRKDLVSVEEDPKDTNIRFLESINLRLADEITFLRGIVTDLMTDNRLLLSKLIRAPKNLDPNYSPPDMEPISGYQSLNSKIREAEEKAKEEYDKSQIPQNKDD